MKLKTATKISFIFTGFVFFLSLLLLAFVNILTFLGWYHDEKDEESMKLTSTYLEMKNESEDYSQQLNKLYDELREKGGFIGTIPPNYTHIIFDMYKKNSQVFIIKSIGTYFGPVHLPYEVTGHYENQIKMFYLSLLGLFIIIIISFFVSEFIFIHFALKDFLYLVRQLKSISLEKIHYIQSDIQPNDELYEIVFSINKFLEQIEKNTKNLYEFNAMLSHEFKTPLMIISSEIEIMEVSKNPDVSLNKIQKQVSLLNKFIETFLFISKVQNKTITPQLQSENISSDVHDILTDLENVFSSKNITLLNKVSPNISFPTDKNIFYIITKNLVENSFKYTPEKGKITVELTQEFLAITDTGIGINKVNIQNVFDIFYKTHDETKGYGVGLNIVKKLCDILGYTIEIDSQESLGTQIIIYFNFTQYVKSQDLDIVEIIQKK